MSIRWFTAAVMVGAALTGFAAVQDEADFPRAEPGEQHEWLRQLVGEWVVAADATMPDGESMEMRSTATGRMLGDLWLVIEGRANVGGVEMRTQMTVGYDPAQEAFVGNWVDSVQTHMWIYRGTLDEAGKSLTLETRGPSFDGSGRMQPYRDILEVRGPDRAALHSETQGEDGTWTRFMTAEYRRKEGSAR